MTPALAKMVMHKEHHQGHTNQSRPESHRKSVDGTKDQSDSKEAFQPQRPGDLCKIEVVQHFCHGNMQKAS